MTNPQTALSKSPQEWAEEISKLSKDDLRYGEWFNALCDKIITIQGQSFIDGVRYAEEIR